VVSLPCDSHVHSEWSWDARAVGSMEQSCARAIEIGLPAIAFTEHLDHTVWRIDLEGP
jgi:histidinol-phosphatase (PHP family)